MYDLCLSIGKADDDKRVEDDPTLLVFEAVVSVDDKVIVALLDEVDADEEDVSSEGTEEFDIYVRDVRRMVVKITK